MLNKLNAMAKAFVDKFNEVHQGGKGLAGSTNIPFSSIQIQMM